MEEAIQLSLQGKVVPLAGAEYWGNRSAGPKAVGSGPRPHFGARVPSGSPIWGPASGYGLLAGLIQNSPFNSFLHPRNVSDWKTMRRMFLVFGASCLLLVLKAGAVTPAILSEPQSVTVNNASAAAFHGCGVKRGCLPVAFPRHEQPARSDQRDFEPG
jgi:hypothetical protein